MSKTQEQLNAEYTLTLRHLRQFCGRMIQQTGQGAPEIEIFTTTILNIQTAWQQPSLTLEAVVRERMQESIAFYREQLSALDRGTRRSLSDRILYTRRCAACTDLWQRMEQGTWTLPAPIAPMVFCLVIDPHFRQFSFEEFFSALYHAYVCDLRVGFASGAFGKGALYAQTCPSSYRRIALAESDGLAALHSELERNVSDHPLALLVSHEQRDMEVVLHQHFPNVEFVFLPKPLPAVLL